MKKLKLLAIATVVTLTFVGCSNDTSESSKESKLDRLDDPGFLLSAVSKTVDRNTSRVELTVTQATPGSEGAPARNFNLTGNGVFDYSDHVGKMTMSVTPDGEATSIQADQIIYRSDVYMKSTSEESAPLGDKWVKIDALQLANLPRTSVNPLTQSTAAEPTYYLDLLEGAATDITKVGTEALRGDSVEHYKMTLDVAKAARSSSGDRKVALEKFLTWYDQPLPAELWLDEQDRVRKIVVTIDVGKIRVGATATTLVGALGTITVAQEFFDFGTPVDVTVPPADQVIVYPR